MLVALNIWEHYESLILYCRSENVSQSCFHVELAVYFVSMFTTVSSYYYLFLMNIYRQDFCLSFSLLNIICTVFISFLFTNSLVLSPIMVLES